MFILSETNCKLQFKMAFWVVPNNTNTSYRIRLQLFRLLHHILLSANSRRVTYATKKPLTHSTILTYNFFLIINRFLTIDGMQNITPTPPQSPQPASALCNTANVTKTANRKNRKCIADRNFSELSPNFYSIIISN